MWQLFCFFLFFFSVRVVWESCFFCRSLFLCCMATLPFPCSTATLLFFFFNVFFPFSLSLSLSLSPANDAHSVLPPRTSWRFIYFPPPPLLTPSLFKGKRGKEKHVSVTFDVSCVALPPSLPPPPPSLLPVPSIMPDPKKKVERQKVRLLHFYPEKKWSVFDLQGRTHVFFGYRNNIITSYLGGTWPDIDSHHGKFVKVIIKY